MAQSDAAQLTLILTLALALNLNPNMEQAAQSDVARRDPVQVLLKASGVDGEGEGEGLRHPLDKSVYAVGARVRVTGHWRARGGKAAQSEQWLLVAHTVLVLTAAPSVQR